MTSQPPHLLCEKLASRFLSVSQRTLQAWRVAGSGPAYIKMGRAVRYSPDDLQNWINSKRQGGGAGYGS